MKHCKFYRPKEKYIESDLLYVRLDKKNCLHYVYPDGSSASSAYSIENEKAWLAKYYTEIPEHEVALL